MYINIVFKNIITKISQVWSVQQKKGKHGKTEKTSTVFVRGSQLTGRFFSMSHNFQVKVNFLNRYPCIRTIRTPGLTNAPCHSRHSTLFSLNYIIQGGPSGFRMFHMLSLSIPLLLLLREMWTNQSWNEEVPA